MNNLERMLICAECGWYGTFHTVDYPEDRDLGCTNPSIVGFQIHKIQECPKWRVDK